MQRPLTDPREHERAREGRIVWILFDLLTGIKHV